MSRDKIGPSRDATQALPFADPQTLASMLEKGRKLGSNQWMALCPCHGDTKPSLSIRWGRNGDTLVHCFGHCTWPQLRDYFSKERRVWLSPAPPPPPKKPKQPVTVATSVAFAVCTLSERRMHDLIAAGQKPSYDSFQAAGVRRESIPGGLRALEALGLIGVDRSMFRLERGRYDRNRYWTKDQWWNLEPANPSKEAQQAARCRAKAIAEAARKGLEVGLDAHVDTPVDIGKAVPLKPENATTDLRVSGVPVRGTVSPPTSYEKDEGKDHSASRPTEVDEEGGWRSREGGGDDAKGDPGQPLDGDGPGQTLDADGWEGDPAPADEAPVGEVISFRPPAPPKPPPTAPVNLSLSAAVARFEAEVAKAGAKRLDLYRELIVPLVQGGQLNFDEIYRLTLMMQGRWPPQGGARQ